MPENASEVTAAGIARLAGVGRAAVSNWRRRHPDFPRPVGGTEASPSFALSEVEQWLRDQGKLAVVPLRERVWQQIADHPAGAATALIQAGCALLLVQERPSLWRELTAQPDERMAELLPTALEQVLTARFGDERVRRESHEGRDGPESRESEPLRSLRSGLRGGAPARTAVVPLLRAVGELSKELVGASQAFEFLLGRFFDANPRQYTLTPPAPAQLMAALAGPAQTVLDPAAGTGALLRAAERPATLYAQDSDPDLAALTALRLALHSDAAVRSRSGDTLRADAFQGAAVDAVLCHPPFNERNWGHDELAYDPRWEYGFPARTESELAWVQHALARLRPGGTAVVLMPPAAASRRSGRRIRAGLLRRGALRAVVALPAGAAPPYGIPLHLWVLRRPDASQPAVPELLLVDTAEPAGAGAQGGGRDRLDWQAVQAAVLDAWRPFDQRGTVDERPGVSRSVPVIELLDDEVDLAPARHVRPPAAGGDADELERVRERLTDTLRLAGELTPAAAGHAPPAPWPATTVGELARAGALVLRAGGSGATSGAPVPVLTEQDVLAGTAPSGTLPEGPDEEPVRVEVGDVVVPVLGGGLAVRVVEEATAGAALGRNLQLLHPDPAALDSWFLAGFLRGTANNRQASSYASTATRLDVRRLQLPRLPLADQRRYGERFRALAAFEDALRLAGRLGEQLVQGLYDGLTDGTVRPE
ncbi:N-6 DNA methylase [Streptomyces sp. NPDC020681]|uniref:N-6 DNA methylase n=1 Tax=Streptomyces sp. NPDC020681 TaxID=3365083 RepID=UPI0037A7B342